MRVIFVLYRKLIIVELLLKDWFVTLETGVNNLFLWESIICFCISVFLSFCVLCFCISVFLCFCISGIYFFADVLLTVMQECTKLCVSSLNRSIKIVLKKEKKISMNRVRCSKVVLWTHWSKIQMILYWEISENVDESIIT